MSSSVNGGGVGPGDIIQYSLFEVFCDVLLLVAIFCSMGVLTSHERDPWLANSLVLWEPSSDAQGRSYSQVNLGEN